MSDTLRDILVRYANDIAEEEKNQLFKELAGIRELQTADAEKAIGELGAIKRHMKAEMRKKEEESDKASTPLPL